MLVFIVRGRPRIISARAVYQDVARPQILQHLSMNCLQCLWLQHVCLIALADEALCLTFLRQLLHRVLIQIQRRHLRSRLRKCFRHCTAEYAACSCHNYNFSRKIDIQR